MTGFAKPVRDIVLERSEGRCERCSTASAGMQLHHRRPRGMGGSKAADTNTAANCLALCPQCHFNIELSRESALHLGYLVRQGQAPESQPVFYRGQWVFLNNDGTVGAKK